MIYGSVCSGIEAATQAWEPLRWKPAFFSEIDKFPSSVLAHHYGANMPGEPLTTSGVPNLGDMTKFKEWPDYAIDLLVGGTPCQSHSVAGPRTGLDDPRGRLMLTFGAIAKRYRPEWIVWENVTGVLSGNKGRDFGTFLGMLGVIGYGFAYRVLDTQHVQTHRFPRAIPQRRERIFVVGNLTDWRRAAAVLFDAESLQGHPAPRRKTGQSIAADIAPSLVSSGRGVERTGETRGQDPVIAVTPIASTLNAAFGEKLGLDDQHINSGAPLFVAEVGNPTPRTAQSSDDVSKPVLASGQQSFDPDLETLLAVQDTPAPHVMAFNSRKDPKVTGDRAGPLGASTPQAQAVAFDLRGREGGAMPEGPHDTAAIRAASGGSSRSYVALPWAVRRLMPVETERLQGFPDNFTKIPWRGKPADQCPDGKRYKTHGNSMSVNVMEWIGQRIEYVSKYIKEEQI